METFSYKSIVINLISIPRIRKCRRSEPRHRVKTGRSNSRRGEPRRPTLGRIICYWIDCFYCLEGIRTIPIVTEPETIAGSRTEKVIFFDGKNLAFGDRLLQNIVEN